MPQNHPTAPRGAHLAPQSEFIIGRFGRMFRNLHPFTPKPDDLKALGATMFEGANPGPDGTIPAGYTYLGQFIDHDITFDPVSSLQRLRDPDGLHDFRTPRLDLDCLYGRGPNNDPFMYDQTIDGGKTSFLIGQNGDGELDLPRNVLPPDANGVPQGRALIGDPRNDENTIVSQLQLLFLRFHNKVVEHVRGEHPALAPDELFTRAQRLVQWHYQWIVAHDFLHRTVGDAIVQDILKRGAAGPNGKKPVEVDLKFFKWQKQPFMPVEFSVAAYRFGHSMIRSSYALNGVVGDVPIFTDGPILEEHQDLRGFRTLPSQWEIEWKFFFETGTGNPQHARKIDTKLSAPLKDVAGTDDPHALAVRNLLRGRALKLPSGQAVATAMGHTPLTDAELGLPAVFAGHAPLWYYVLKEAETSGGAHLGPVGGRIVAEVLLGLMKGDPFSYVNVEPTWEPTLGQHAGVFKMQDLIAFVG
jgi:hypothetical protein